MAIKWSLPRIRDQPPLPLYCVSYRSEDIIARLLANDIQKCALSRFLPCRLASSITSERAATQLSLLFCSRQPRSPFVLASYNAVLTAHYFALSPALPAIRVLDATLVLCCTNVMLVLVGDATTTRCSLCSLSRSRSILHSLSFAIAYSVSIRCAPSLTLHYILL